MNWSSRSFGAKRIALHRTHLLPVEPSTWHKVHNAAFSGPERWWVSLLLFVAIGAVALLALALAA